MLPGRLLNDMEATIYRRACEITRAAGRDLPLPGDTSRILDLAYAAGKRWRASWDSWSGTDQADGEVYKCIQDCYMAIAGGEALETAIAAQDRIWRAYATDQARKVDEAPKIKRGGSAGLSVISHRWVSPEFFADKARMIRLEVEAIYGAI